MSPLPPMTTIFITALSIRTLRPNVTARSAWNSRMCPCLPHRLSDFSRRIRCRGASRLGRNLILGRRQQGRRLLARLDSVEDGDMLTIGVLEPCGVPIHDLPD